MTDTAELTVATDAEGYLVDPADCNEDIARALATREGLLLGDDHWHVIRLMREWLDEHGVTADARHVTKAFAGDREAGRGRLFQLFPLR